jgi:PAS domain S-box-containing protein
MNRQPLRVLIVEDSMDDAELVERLLGKAGYNVTAARVETAASFVSMLSDREWDVIIADYAVPGFGAIPALRLLKDSARDIPFLIVTGAIGEEAAVASMRAGANDFVMKDKIGRLVPAIEREMQEAAVRRSAREMEIALRLRVAALQAAANAIVITDREGTIEWANSSFTGLTGYSPEEVIGQNPRILNSRSHERPFFEEMWNTILSGGVWHGELINRRKDSTQYVEEMTITPVHFANGAITHFIAVKENITARKRGEEALRTSQERLASIIDSAMDVIVTVDYEFKIVVFNHAAEQTFGIAASEAIGRPLEDFIPERFHEIHRRHREEFGRAGVASRSITTAADVVGRRFDGTEFPIEANISQIHSGGEKLYTIILRDISDRKRAEDALRAREAQLQAVLDVLPVGVLLCDAAGNIVRANPMAEVIWGGPVSQTGEAQRRECTGRHPGTTVKFQPDDWPLARAVKRGESTVAKEIEVQNFQGKRKTLLSYAVPIRAADGGSGGAVSVELDITDRKSTQQALIKSEKLASVGRMAATIAHEINNPLSAVMNSLFLVAAHPELPPGVRHHLEVAQRELERTAHITKQTLGFYREGASRPTTIQLREVLDQILDIYGPRFRNTGVRIERQDCDSRQIYGIDGEVRQIVSNLVANSLDAMRPGGILHVRTSLVSRREHPTIALTVADTGSGIAPEHIDQIFEPFFTTKQSVGTGLGLWVTRELVTKNDGRIKIRSQIGKGTVVTVWLPAERRQPGRRSA